MHLENFISPGLVGDAFGLVVVCVPIAIIMLYFGTAWFRSGVNKIFWVIMWSPYVFVVALGAFALFFLYSGGIDPHIFRLMMLFALIISVVIALRFMPWKEVLYGVGTGVFVAYVGLCFLAALLYMLGWAVVEMFLNIRDHFWPTQLSGA